MDLAHAGHIFEKIDAITFAIFCGSIAENVHSAELVVFVAFPISVDVLNISHTYGVTLLGFDSSSFPVLESFNPSIFWWLFIHQHIFGSSSEWRGSVDNILFVDVTKYVFFSDPFAFIGRDGVDDVLLLGNLPCLTLASRPPLMSVLGKCFGASMKAAAESKSFSEADFIMGKAETFRLLTKRMLMVMLGNTDMGWRFPECASSLYADRALLNVLVRLGATDVSVSIANPSQLSVLDFSIQYFNNEDEVWSTMERTRVAVLRDYPIIGAVFAVYARKYASWLNVPLQALDQNVRISNCSEQNDFPQMDVPGGCFGNSVDCAVDRIANKAAAIGFAQSLLLGRLNSRHFSGHNIG